MKHNWEYKRLFEISDELFAGGDVPKDCSKEQLGLYQYPVFTNGVEREGLYGYCKEPRVLKPSVTIASRGTIGTVFKRMKPFSPAIRLITVVPKDLITISFLAYFLKSQHLTGNGVTIPQLTVPMVKNNQIPIPPKETQERIVAELDKINELIEVKREQLTQLDALAQSIFYTMFGDPITNPKGWPIKKLSEICNAISTGVTYKPDMVADKGTIVLRSSNIQNSQFVLDDIVRIQMPLKENQYVRKNDILMCSRNGSARLVGKVTLIPELNERMSWGAFMTIIRSEHYPYLFQFFQLPCFREQLSKTKTTTVNQITIGMLKGIIVPFPSMPLQEQFAAKVEAIEAQKATVEKSIAELQTLLDSRMDYWFN